MWPNVYKETLYKLHIKNEIMFLINEEKFFESWISFLYVINVLVLIYTQCIFQDYWKEPWPCSPDLQTVPENHRQYGSSSQTRTHSHPSDAWLSRNPSRGRPRRKVWGSNARGAWVRLWSSETPCLGWRGVWGSFQVLFQGLSFWSPTLLHGFGTHNLIGSPF